MLNPVRRSLEQLDEWITCNGWAGYDPYDIRGQTWYVSMFGTWCPKKLKTALYIIERSLPQYGLRRFLRIRKEINAKGMGLLASAYLTRYRTTDEKQFLEKAEAILSWLNANACHDYGGTSWGYPFHWQSRIMIPRGTPSIVVSGTVGDAVLDHYELTGSPSSYKMLQGVADFFLNGLNRSVDEPDRVCFSYTPLDKFTVLNASLFAAVFLARFFSVQENPEYRELSLRAVRYVLSEQNDDGSFYYWGSEPPTDIDHYHTGFVLRHLDTIQRVLDEKFIAESLVRGYKFYLDRLFSDAGLPKHTPDSLYPMNIHSFAEALLCLSQLGPRLGGFDRVHPIFQFANEKMRSQDGWYVAERRITWIGERTADVPFIRWSQAWMFLALARLEQQLNANTPRNEDVCASA